MTRSSLYCLILIGLLTVTQSSHFKKLYFQKGKVSNYRSLATAPDQLLFDDSSLPQHSVQVTFGAPFTATAGATSTPSMFVVISSNETLLTTNASISQFRTFTCTGSCPTDSAIVNLTYPYLQGSTANRGNSVSISALNGAWKLNALPLFLLNYTNSMPPIQDTSSIKSGQTYGWIGLGLKGNASTNFPTTTPIFSIRFTDFEQGNGMIMFGNDTNYANSSSYLTSLPTNENWEISFANIYFGSSNFTSTLPTSIIFDIQFGDDDDTYISLPTVYFNQIKEALLNLGLVFNADNYRLSIPGSPSVIDTLPTFIFNTTSGAQYSLTPEVYMYYENLGMYSTVFIPQDLTSADGTYQYVVFGWPVLRYYYATFSNSSKGQTIELFNSPAPVINNTPGTGVVNNTDQPTNNNNDTNTNNTNTNNTNTNTNNTSTNTTTPTTGSTTSSGSGGYGLLIFILVLVVLLLTFVAYVKIRRMKAAASNAAQEFGLDTHLKTGGSADAANSIRL